MARARGQAAMAKAIKQARAKGLVVGAPVRPARAPRRDARAVPKRGPRPPLVEHVMVMSVVRTILPITVDRLVEELGQVGRPASAKMLVGHVGLRADIIAESVVTRPAWRIRWDELYPSQNVLMRKYANAHAYAGLIAKWAKIFWTAMVTGAIPKATGRRRLTITRYIRDEKYRLDRGNLVGGGKPFLDAAVRAGLIRNDRETDVDDQYRQAIDPDERVELLVEDL